MKTREKNGCIADPRESQGTPIIGRGYAKIVVLLILTIALAAALLTGCQAPTPPPEIEEPEIEEPIIIIEEPEEEPIPEPTPLPELSAIAREYHARNEDTVGWVYVPNTTTINEFVLWYPNDANQFYLRRNFYREWSFDGVYFADARTQWGDFMRENISRNIVIYGHSMDGNPDGTLFSQLKRWQDEEWARNNPLVFFSTLEEDMAWEIFSVHFSNIWVPYNNPNPDDELFQFIIDDAKARSLWIYEDIEVTIEDTILTFSTCIYSIPEQASPTGYRIALTYPNNFRFVIMARLACRYAPLVEVASLSVNPSPVDAGQRP